MASTLLIDVRPPLAAARRYLAAASAAAAVLLLLLGVHVYFSFPVHFPAGSRLPNIGIVTLDQVRRTGLFSLDFNDRLFVALVLLGAAAGLVSRRLRIGFGAALATLVVGWPVSMATTGYTVLHRLVPTVAMQTIAAGAGAALLGAWLPRRLRLAPGLAGAAYLLAAYAHDLRAPNAVTEEFWMLRNHLAPGGAVRRECKLLALGRPMDTDIHDFAQVLPGITMHYCEREDCLAAAAAGGCVYYLRSLNCFFSEIQAPPQCIERGRTATGDILPCLDPRCAELEKTLLLAPVEERTTDVHPVFHGPPGHPQWPRVADIALFEVNGVREPQAAAREDMPK